MQGYIKIYRRLKDHWVFEKDKPFTKFHAFVWILINAQGKPEGQKRLINARLLKEERGTLITSIRYLQKAWNWGSKDKVRRFLIMLENDQIISQETGQGITHITICKYDSYNPLQKVNGTPIGTQTGHKQDSNGTATGHQRDKSKKGKKGNKEKKGKERENARAKIQDPLILKIGELQTVNLKAAGVLEKLKEDVARQDLFLEWLEHLHGIGAPLKSITQFESLLKFFFTYTFMELRQMVNYSAGAGKNYKNLYPEQLERIKNQKQKNNEKSIIEEQRKTEYGNAAANNWA
jgi:hypothetical protein